MKVDRQVAPLDPAQFVQALLERDVKRCGARIGTANENADPCDAGNGLRAGLTRNGEHLARQHQNEGPLVHH
jgi:hypothetical protein